MWIPEQFLSFLEIIGASIMMSLRDSRMLHCS